jgi:hypothetical protein
MPLICSRFFLTTELDCTFRFTDSAYADSTCELRSQGQLGRILSHRIERQGASTQHIVSRRKKGRPQGLALFLCRSRFQPRHKLHPRRFPSTRRLRQLAEQRPKGALSFRARPRNISSLYSVAFSMSPRYTHQRRSPNSEKTFFPPLRLLCTI